MTHDEDTKRFMDALVPPDSGLTPLRQVRSVIRNLGNPKRALGKAIVSKAVLDSAFEKEAATSILNVYHALNEHYKQDWWDWEPETIWQTLTKELGVEAFPELRAMILALQLTLRTNQPFEHWHIFEKVGHAFNFNPVDFSIVQPLELTEIAWAYKVLESLRAKAEYAPEIWTYMAAAAKSSGVVYLPPKYFGEAQAHLDRMHNDLELKALVAAKKNDGSDAFKIQLLRLKEIADYVAQRAKE